MDEDSSGGLDMVNLRQIAERLRYHYNSAQTWWREGMLPEPDILIGGRFPLWHWERILSWACETGRGGKRR